MSARNGGLIDQSPIKDSAESAYHISKQSGPIKGIEDQRVRFYREQTGKDTRPPFVYEWREDEAMSIAQHMNSCGDNILFSPFQHFHKNGQPHRGAAGVTFGDKRDIRACGFNVVTFRQQTLVIERNETPLDFIARRKEARGRLFHAAKNAFDGRGFMIFCDLCVWWLAPLETPIIFPDAQRKALRQQTYQRWLRSQKDFARSISIPEEYWSINQPNFMARVPLAGTISYSSEIYTPPFPISLWEGDLL